VLDLLVKCAAKLRNCYCPIRSNNQGSVEQPVGLQVNTTPINFAYTMEQGMGNTQDAQNHWTF
jgi:hypothetical protein